MSARLVAALAGIVVIGGGAALFAHQRARARSPWHGPTTGPTVAAPGETLLRVPHAPGAITLDGDTDDPGWLGTPGPARTGGFRQESGALALPFSEVRLVWGDGYLYLCLYAADEDIESRTDSPDGPIWLDDSFRVVFRRGDTEAAIEVSPRAVITDSIRRGGGAWDYAWSSGAHASREMDGTLNDPSNMDEEWVIEMAVPFEALGLRGERGETIGLSVSRCDTPKTGARVCTRWGEGETRGRIVLE